MDECGILLVTRDNDVKNLFPRARVYRADDLASALEMAASQDLVLAVVDASRPDVVRGLIDETELEIIVLGDADGLACERILCALPVDTPKAALIAVLEQVCRRVTSERSASERRQQLSDAADLLHFVVYAKDAEGRRTYSNRRDYVTLGGQLADDVLGKTDLDLFPDEIGLPTYQDDLRIVKSGEPVLNHEEHFAIPGHEPQWVLTSKVPLRDAGGRIVGLAGIGFDITARKATEEALAASQARLRASFDSAAVGTAVLSEGRFVEANDATTKIFGYTRDELIQKRLVELTHPDDVAAYREYLLRRLTSGRSAELEVRHISKDGGIVWCLTSLSTVLDAHGERVFTVVHFQDITSRKEAEQALATSEKHSRALIEQSSMAIAVIDVDGHIEQMNAAYLHMYGLTPELGAQVRDRYDAIGGSRPIGHDEGQAIERALGGNEVTLPEYRSNAPAAMAAMGLPTDGVRRPWLRSRYYPLRDAEGSVLKVVVIHEDITERKLAEMAQRRSETRFRALMEQSPLAIAIFDPDGLLSAMNQAYADVYGLGPEAVQERIGRLDLLRVAEYYGGEIEQQIKRAFRGEEVLVPDHVSSARMNAASQDIEPSTTRELWVRSRYFPILDEEGQVAHVVLFQEDVSESVSAAKALEESEARFRAMVEQSPMGVALFDETGKLIELNDSFVRIHRLDPNAVETMLRHVNILEAGRQAGGVFGDVCERAFAGEAMTFDVHRSKAAFTLGVAGLGLLPVDLPWVRTHYYPVKDASGQAVFVALLVEDVSDQVAAEEARRQSEARFRALMEQSPLGIAVFDPNGTMTAMNQAYADAYGLSPEAVQERIGRLNLLRAVELRGGEMQSLVESAFAGGTVLIPEYKARASQNAETLGFTQGTRNPWVRSRYFPILNEDGGVARVVLLMEDISDWHQAQEDARASEKRYRTLFENMAQGVFYQSAPGRMTDINQAALDIFGITRQAALESTQYDPGWYVVDDNGKRLAPEEFPSIIALTTGEPVLNRIVGVRNQRDGQLRWVNIHAFPREETGHSEPSHVFVTMQDITAQRSATWALIERESQLRHVTSRQEALLSAIPDIVTETDSSKTITWMNQAGLAFYGDGAVGLQASDFFIGEQQTYAVVEPLFEGSEETIYVESWQRRHDGESRLLAWWCRTLKDHDGNVVGALSTARDVTDQRTLEEQYRQSQKMESVGRLAGGVAHDFNNMLQVILGHTEMALEQVDSESEILDDLTEIRNAAQHSAGLTRQLLGFARQQTVSPKVLDLNEAVSSMLRMLQRLIGEEVDLIWKPGASLGSVRMDPSQLDQVLANLCVNARDAIDGVGEVLIETRNVDFDFEYCRSHADCQPGQYVMVSVSDTGCGMGPEVIEHLFEPFFTTKDVGQGTGLGLATVYGIVRQNDGFVNVYSEVDEGTTFRIYLPRLNGAAPQREEEQRRTVARGSETILIVEDEPTILRLAQVALKRQGYTVHAAATPGQALDLLSDMPDNIDLLVTDVVMPEMNGRELRDRILLERPDIKTLFMSGYTSNIVVHRGVIEEGLELLQKPFSIRELATKVRKVLDEA